MSQQQRIEEGFDRLVLAINAVHSAASGFPEVTADPVNPADGSAWVLVTPDGYAAAGFFGAMPILVVSGNSKYELSVKTATGIKRVHIK